MNRDSRTALSKPRAMCGHRTLEPWPSPSEKEYQQCQMLDGSQGLDNKKFKECKIAQ